MADFRYAIFIRYGIDFVYLYYLIYQNRAIHLTVVRALHDLTKPIFPITTIFNTNAIIATFLAYL